ncbi:MAG: lipoate--protein ligase family protein [Limnochordia bacterium]
MTQQWRLMIHGHRTGFWNMALDEALLEGVAAGAPPVLRFYRWRPTTLTIGYFQNSEEIHWSACTSLGIDVVRRPTGGRAILHGEEITYSLILPEDWPGLPSGVTASYKVLAQGIVEGLRKLGLPVDLAPQPQGRHRRGLGDTAACFDAPCWYEVVAQGAKLVGSAQTRRRGAILQHGSIPLVSTGEVLAQILHFPTEKRRQAFLKMMEKRSRALRDFQPELDFDGVWPTLALAWSQILGFTYQPGEPTAEEKEGAEKLHNRKYAQDWWNKFGPRKGRSQIEA